MNRITIDPVTRLEGHGKIEILLDAEGEVANAYFQIPELRGFERFCVGRLAEDMPNLTDRICGVCPEAHHLAATKALDELFVQAFARRFPGTGGALYGRATHGWRASFARPGSRTRIPGLYLAGGSTHPGPGVPMAALSGRLAATCVLEDLASTRP